MAVLCVKPAPAEELILGDRVFGVGIAASRGSSILRKDK